MKYILAALLLVAQLAVAQTTFTCNVPVAFSCTPTAATCAPPQPANVTQPCPPGQSGTITTTFVCSGSTWTPTSINSCVTPPPPGGVTIIPAPPIGGSPPVFHASAGVNYAFLLPVVHGSVAISRAPQSNNFNVKVALSLVPADYATAQAMPVQKQGFGGVTTTVYPYYAVQSDESAGLGWTSINDGRGTPVVAAGWYFTVQADREAWFYMQIPQQ